MYKVFKKIISICLLLTIVLPICNSINNIKIVESAHYNGITDIQIVFKHL